MKKKMITALGVSAIILTNFVGSTYADSKTGVSVTGSLQEKSNSGMVRNAREAFKNNQSKCTF